MRRPPSFVTFLGPCLIALVVATAAPAVADGDAAKPDVAKTCGTQEDALKRLFGHWTTESASRACGGMKCLANARDRAVLTKAMTTFFVQVLSPAFPRIGLKAVPVTGAEAGNVVLGSTRTYVTMVPLDFDDAELAVTKQGGGAAVVTLALYDGVRCIGSQTLDFEAQDTAGQKLRLKQKGAFGSFAVVRIDAKGTGSFDYKLELAKAGSAPGPAPK